MNGPHELSNVIFHAPQDAVVAPLRGSLNLRAGRTPQSRNTVLIFDHSSQLVAEGLLPTVATEAKQATQWLLDITGAKLNCETVPLTQTGSFIFY
jgi:hypothetical protein